MKNTGRRLLALALALIMVLVCFAVVGCTNPEDPKDPTTPNDPTDPSTPTDPTTPTDPDDPTDPGDEPDEDDYLLMVPKQDFGKKTYTFLATENGLEFSRDKEVYVASEEDAVGSIVDTAIFNRNNTVAEYMNVTFDIRKTASGAFNDYPEFQTIIQQSQQAGDQDFQLISSYEVRTSELVLAGLTYDFNSIDTFDSSRPWYVQGWIDAATVNGKTYMMVSDLSLNMWRFTNVLCFNKQLSDRLGITDDLYEVALNEDLTLEYVMNYASMISEDDGNDVWDEKDTYGIVFNVFNCRAFATYFDVEVYGDDGMGGYEIVLMDDDHKDHTEAVFSTMQNYICNENYVYMNNVVYPTDDNNIEVSLAMFAEDRLLFMPAEINDTQALRDMEGTFGFLPMPKFNDEQIGYRTHVNDTMTVFCIPSHAENPEFNAAVFDALSAENKSTVIPAYYDVVIKGRTAKDEESQLMLDMIRDSITFNFGYAHGNTVKFWSPYGDCWNPARSSVGALYDRESSMYQGYLGTVLDKYWELTD